MQYTLHSDKEQSRSSALTTVKTNKHTITPSNFILQMKSNGKIHFFYIMIEQWSIKIN